MASSAMEQDTHSTYDSIIPEYETKWPPLPGSHPFAQLHNKFWGVSMQDEETKWRETQSEDVPMNVDVDNETAEEDEGDEIGPGCYILRLGIPGITHATIWIRQEYIRIYDFCQKHMDFCRTSPIQRHPSVVVTGQPGIGKTYWSRYALRRCLAEKKPVMWYHDMTLFLFVKEGVYQAPLDFKRGGTTLQTPVWTLIDTEEAKSGVPPHLSVASTMHFIILTTSSPKRSLWTRLLKIKHCRVCVMNPWTKTEISKAAVIHGLENNKRIYEMYDQYGPTPRICFNYLRKNLLLMIHRADYDSALRDLSIERLHQMVSDLQGCTMDAVSHTLLLTKRPKDLRVGNPKEDPFKDGRDFAFARVELVSPVVEMAIQVRLWEESQVEQLALYQQMANFGSTRCIAGLAFKAWAHTTLQKRIVLHLVPMVIRELHGSGQGKELPRWHSNHGEGRDPLSVRPIDITPLKTKVYKGSRLDQIEDKIYYIPENKNQVAFDSFIMADGNLYIFQCSIASDHPITAGILPFFSQDLTLPPWDQWYFVFVVPNEPRQEIACPQPRDSGLKALLAADKMKLYTAPLDLV